MAKVRITVDDCDRMQGGEGIPPDRLLEMTIEGKEHYLVGLVESLRLHFNKTSIDFRAEWLETKVTAIYQKHPWSNTIETRKL